MYIPLTKKRKLFINNGLVYILMFLLIVIGGYVTRSQVSAEKKNCSSFTNQPSAQVYYNALINSPDTEARKSAERLDRDKDMLACESLPLK